MANMAPTWLPRWSQNGEKFDAKIDQKIDASWDRFLEGFWWILGGKMEASWHQNGIKNVHNFERRFFEKSCSRCSGGSIFEILGVEVGSKNRSKNDMQHEVHLGIDFWWILIDFRSQVGVEHRPKIDAKRCRKSDQKKKGTR